MNKIKLFCLPYAGGSAMIYNKWKRYLDNSIELCPVELAGRGKRFNNTFYNSFDEAIDDALEVVRNELNDEADYAVFGHSMGSIMAYQLINKITDELNYKEPVHAFFSGRYPPHIKKDERIFHKLPDDEFIEEISKYGGTPKEFFENKELMSIFIPILRADYMILETREHSEDMKKFGFDISVLTGLEDHEVGAEEVREWGEYTAKEFKLYEFDGGHFFINDKTEDIVNIINNTLL